jgi:hypothetical protein
MRSPSPGEPSLYEQTLGHERRRQGRAHRPARSFVMLDILVMAIGFGFFGLFFAYTAACDGL